MVVGPAFSEGNNALVAEATVHHMNRILDEWRKKEKDGRLKLFSLGVFSE